jgi:hypothetical protein
MICLACLFRLSDVCDGSVARKAAGFFHGGLCCCQGSRLNLERDPSHVKRGSYHKHFNLFVPCLRNIYHDTTCSPIHLAHAQCERILLHSRPLGTVGALHVCIQLANHAPSAARQAGRHGRDGMLLHLDSAGGWRLRLTMGRTISQLRVGKPPCQHGTFAASTWPVLLLG